MDDSSQSSKPFPAGCQFGSHLDIQTKTGLERSKWWWQFDFDAGKWIATFVADEQLTELAGVDDTPKAAFEQLVTGWTFMNGGEESPTLRELLPRFRSLFGEDGNIDQGSLMVKE